MVDWFKIFSNSLWLVGLALILAVASYTDYGGWHKRLSIAPVWRAILSNGWTRLGALLFCAGMALAAGTWPEKIVWGLLGAYALYGAWRALQRGPAEWLRTLRGPWAGDLASAPDAPLPGPLPLSAPRRVADRVIRAELLWLGLLAPFILFATQVTPVDLLGLPI